MNSDNVIKTAENKTMYGIKMIAAVFVVFIHSVFPGTFGILMKNIARFAVPLFFIISGYFWKTTDFGLWGYRTKIKRRIRKTCRLAAYSLAVYFLVNIGLYILRGQISEFPLVLLNIVNWLKLLLFNYTTPLFGVGHLWYLLALIYVYLIIAIIEKNNAWHQAYIISVFLVIISIAFECVSVFSSHVIPGYIYRNWLFVGIPLFCFGRWMKEHEPRIKRLNTWVLMLIYVAVLIAETILAKDGFEIMFCCAVPVCLLLMKTAIEHPDINTFSTAGKKYSQWVYVYHYIFVIAVGLVCSRFDVPFLGYIQPIIVVALTFGFSCVTQGLNKKVLGA